jgi:hypothetical protein
MKICFRLERCILALALAACNGNVGQPNVPQAGSDGSWIASDAATSPLLYVSDWNTNAVFVYNYKSGAAAGRLTGFQTPYGQCVDSKGHVWIAEFGGHDVVEYAHGGKAPLRRLRTTGFPIGCSVDPATGDLAVANFYTKKGPGNIQVWQHAQGKPATYTPSRLFYLWPPAYDDKGNIFVEGQIYHGAYGLAKLPKGGKSLEAVSLNGATIHYAGAVLWDGTHVGLTDQDSDNTTVIFRTSIIGLRAKIVGRTHLTDTCNKKNVDVVQPFLVKSRNGSNDVVIGGNLWCAGRFDTWAYPAGGNPESSLHDAPQQPFGQSVSPGE